MARPKVERRGRPTKFDMEAVCRAILEAKGNYTEAGRILGVSRQSVANWVANDPVCKAAYEEAVETFLDETEWLLKRKAFEGSETVDGDPWAIKLILERKGKHRGWADSREAVEAGALIEAMARLTQQQQAIAYDDLRSDAIISDCTEAVV
jgi:hypothetical protein